MKRNDQKQKNLEKREKQVDTDLVDQGQQDSEVNATSGDTKKELEKEDSLEGLSAREIAELGNAKVALEFIDRVRSDMDELAGQAKLESLGKHLSTIHEQTSKTNSPMFLPQQKAEVHETLGRFQIIDVVGEGGFAKVFRAYDPTLDRELAIKVPKARIFASPELQTRFQREARAAAMLSHPAIVPVYDVGTIGVTSFIASEYCPGSNLADWMAKNNRHADVRTTVEMMICLAEAVHHAHQRGVIHRDLKPANILVVDGDEPIAKRLRITDFGLAKQMNSDDATVTTDGAILGTPAYMSPEQARGDKDVGASADQFSLGIIFYQLLTGQLPFTKPGHLKTLMAIQNDTPQSPRKLNTDLPRDLESVCLKCMSKSESDRYESTFDLASDLRAWLEGRPVVARPVPALQKLASWSRRNRALAAALAFAFLSLVAGLALTSWKWQESNRNWALASTETKRANEETKKANEAAEQAKKSEEEATTAGLRSEKFGKRSSGVLNIVVDSFLGTHPIYGGDPNMSAKKVLENARDGLSKSNLDDEGKAMLFSALSSSYMGLGEFQAGLDAARRSRDLHQSVFGKDSPEALVAMCELAEGYMSAADYKAAETILKEVTSRMESVEVGMLVRIRASRGMGTIYRSKGMVDEAIDSHRKTIRDCDDEIRRAEANGESPSRHTYLNKAYSLMDLANCLADFDRMDEEDVLDLCEQAVAINRRYYPDSHPRVLQARDKQAHVLTFVDQNEEALEIRRELFELTKQKWGSEHLWAIQSMIDLASSLSSLQQYPEAVKRYEEAIELAESELSSEHSVTLRAKDGCAMVYVAIEQPGKAVELLREVLVCRRSKFAEDNPRVLRTMVHLADALSGIGETKEAIELCQEAIEGWKTKGDPSIAGLLRAKHSLAKTYAVIRKHKEAIELTEEILVLLRQKHPPGHSHILAEVVLLGNLYSVTGRTEEAVPLLSEAEEAYRLRYSESHPNRLSSLFALAVCHRRQGNLAESIELFDSVLEASENVFPPSYYLVPSARAYRALSIYDLGETEKGLTLLDEVHSDFINNNNIGWVRTELIKKFWKAKRPDDLFRVVEKYISVIRDAYPELATTEKFAIELTGCASKMLSLGDFERAEPLIRESVEIRNAINADSWELAQSESMLGESLRGQKKFKEAKQLLESSFQKLEDQADAIPSNGRKKQLTAAVDRLLRLAQATEDSEAILKWQEKLIQLGKDE